MDSAYSIVDARNNFATLVRHAEQSREPVHVTRRGQAVVVILSAAEYERLKQHPETDWLAGYQAWREKWGLETVSIDPDAIWGDVRDKTPLETENPWL